MSNDVSNKTRNDAYVLLLKSRSGSLANGPTMEFLKGLRNGIQTWLNSVDKAIDDEEKRLERLPCPYGCETFSDDDSKCEVCLAKD